MSVLIQLLLLPVPLWNIATVPSAKATNTRPFTCLQKTHKSWLTAGIKYVQLFLTLLLYRT